MDVTIRGAGIFGLSIAWQCALRGASVQVIDPNGIGAGSSGGIVGALAPHVPENWNTKKEFQFQSLIAAEPFWAQVERVSGISSGYGRLGRIQPITNENQLTLAHQRAENAKALWQNKAEWRVIDTAPLFAPSSTTGFWIKDTLSARLNPRLACNALEKALRLKGVAFAGEGVDKGKTLWATGAEDLFHISKRLKRPFGNGVKGQAALFDLDRRDCAQVFAQTMHFIPHADGTLAVGSTSERTYEDGTSTDEKLHKLISDAREVLEDLKTAKLIQTWAGVRPRTTSRAPVLGIHPLYPNAYIANGGFKIGLAIAPKIAEVMSDFILDGTNNIPEDFLPEKSLTLSESNLFFEHDGYLA